jgi:hypothetical protein
MERLVSTLVLASASGLVVQVPAAKWRIQFTSLVFQHTIGEWTLQSKKEGGWGTKVAVVPEIVSGSQT